MPFQLKIKEWYIFYGDETVIKGDNIDTWHNAPNENVQAILLRYEDGKPEVISKGAGLYCMWKNQHGIRFEGCNKGDGFSYPDECQPDGIKCGMTIDTDLFLKIITKAQEMRDDS